MKKIKIFKNHLSDFFDTQLTSDLEYILKDTKNRQKFLKKSGVQDNFLRRINAHAKTNVLIAALDKQGIRK